MKDKKFVLLVEDEERIAKIEMAFLEHAGYIVLHIKDGQTALEAITRYIPDLVVLDRLLPNKDGLTICKEIRELSNVPIIMVTALQDEHDRLDGFSAGVDDYLCKPFNPQELVARVTAILNRVNKQSSSDQFLVDHGAMSLTAKGQSVELTRSEYCIISTLVKANGKVVNRQSILDKCFEEKNLEIFDRTIDNHIKNLRKKIAKLVPGKDLIQSVYGVGYIFKQ